MRAFKSNENLSAQVYAGTHVALIGLNVSSQAREGLLGFKIERKTSGEQKFITLRGGSRQFKNFDAEAIDDSATTPIQSMMWADYTLEPGTKYQFKVTPIHGTPGKTKNGKHVLVNVETERTDDQIHGIYFNRGVAGSQAYSRRFGKYMRYYPFEQGFGDRKKLVPKPFIKPDDIPGRKAFKWLSRGLEEGLLNFLAQAKDESWSVRASVYEFSWKPAIKAFVNAIDRGADVKIVHHCKMQSDYSMKYEKGKQLLTTSHWGDGSKPDVVFKDRYGRKTQSPDGIARAAIRAVSELGSVKEDNVLALEKLLIKRTNTAISHNKFIVLLKDGVPQQVWTGSTNFTGGGIFGQSNVGHIVRDESVAKAYYDFWEMLSHDPVSRDGKAENISRSPNIVGEPSPGITPIFSPRPDEKILKWYANRITAAKSSVFLTTAFTVSDPFLDALKKNGKRPAESPFARYILMEGKGGLLKKKIPIIKRSKDNILAWGEVLRNRKGLQKDHESIETLTGLNDHVNFLHTKYMLIDPLSDDPIVISGSANFSSASTIKNDENMLVIRGNTRVADIFVCEFMRLFNHYQSRNAYNAMSDADFEAAQYLTPDDSWTDPYFTKGTPEWNERMLFCGNRLE